MSKNIVVCCDGTNNEFGSCNTNVVRLVQVLDRDSERQLVYYDPGVGTMPEVGFWSPIGKWFSKVMGLAFGAGLEAKVGQAYVFLMRHYEPGDQIYLYGFSRGAYTVRVLAGVLHKFGLLSAGSENLVPYMLRYAGAVQLLDGKSASKRDLYWRIAREFRLSFSRTFTRGGRESRTVKVKFLGLWDTVSSVGWIWEPKRFPHTAKNPGVEVVRHAVAVDERRAFFRQNRWTAETSRPQDVQELWFPGVHSDVGGGYAESDGGLWRLSFQWMLSESEKMGLIVRRKTVRRMLRRSGYQGPAWASQAHESLTALWWPAEFFPKLRWNAKRRKRAPYLYLFRRRVVADGTCLHGSILRRLRRDDLGYAPRNLSPEFIAKVRSLNEVPSTLAYPGLGSDS